MKKTLRTTLALLLAMLLLASSLLLMVSCNDDDDNNNSSSSSTAPQSQDDNSQGSAQNPTAEARNTVVTELYEMAAGGNGTEYSYDINVNTLFPDSIMKTGYNAYNNVVSSTEIGLIDGLTRYSQTISYTANGQLDDISVTAPLFFGISTGKIRIERNAATGIEKLITTNDVYGNGVNSYTENTYIAGRLSTAVVYSASGFVAENGKASMKVTYKNGRRVSEENYDEGYKVCYEFDKTGNVATATYYKAVVGESGSGTQSNVTYETKYYKKHIFSYTNGKLSSIVCEVKNIYGGDEYYTFTASYNENGVIIKTAYNDATAYEYTVTKSVTNGTLTYTGKKDGQLVESCEYKFNIATGAIIKVTEKEYNNYGTDLRNTDITEFEYSVDGTKCINKVYSYTNSYPNEATTISFNGDGAMTSTEAIVYMYNDQIDISKSSKTEFSYDEYNRYKAVTTYEYYHNRLSYNVEERVQSVIEPLYNGYAFEITLMKSTVYRYSDKDDSWSKIESIMTPLFEVKNFKSTEYSSGNNIRSITEAEMREDGKGYKSMTVKDYSSGIELVTKYEYNEDGSCTVTYPDGSTGYIPPQTN